MFSGPTQSAYQASSTTLHISHVVGHFSEATAKPFDDAIFVADRRATAGVARITATRRPPLAAALAVHSTFQSS